VTISSINVKETWTTTVTLYVSSIQLAFDTTNKTIDLLNRLHTPLLSLQHALHRPSRHTPRPMPAQLASVRSVKPRALRALLVGLNCFPLSTTRLSEALARAWTSPLLLPPPLST
jgi:hypothetical protein